MECNTENEGLRIPAEIRWLGRMVDIRDHFDESQGTVATAAATVLCEATESRLCGSRVRLQGRRHGVEPFEERPDAFCSRCCGWGHIGLRYRATAPRRSLCEGGHSTDGRRRPVEQYGAGRGHPCPHVVAMCRNRKGPHLAGSREFLEKKQARKPAAWWRPLPLPRRERRAKRWPHPALGLHPPCRQEQHGHTSVGSDSQGSDRQRVRR